MLLQNCDCYTAENFEGDAIRFDLPSSLRCLEIAPSHKLRECGIRFSSYAHMMIPNIAFQVLRNHDQSHWQTRFVTRNHIIAISIVF